MDRVISAAIQEEKIGQMSQAETHFPGIEPAG
jgi:hypothetical protein